MKYSGGWSFSEAYNLPIKLREWFIERLLKQLESENQAMEAANSGGGSRSQTLTPHNQPQRPPDMMTKKRQG